MSVTDLGSAVPPPGGGGGGPPNDPLGPLVKALEANTNGLSKLTDRLNGLNPGGKGGPSTGGGSNAGEKALQKQLKMQVQRYRLEEQIHRLTYDALGRLAAFRRKESNDRIAAEKSLARQRSAALNKEAAAIESEQKAAQRKAKALSDRRYNFTEEMRTKLVESVKFTQADLLKAIRLNLPGLARNIRNKLGDQKFNKEQDENIKKQGAKYRLDEQIDNQTATARDLLDKHRAKQAKPQQMLDERRVAFTETLRNKFSTTGQMSTADLQRAMKLGMPTMVNAIRNQINRQTENKWLGKDAKNDAEFQAKQKAKMDAFWKDFDYNISTKLKHSAGLLKRAADIGPGTVRTMQNWNKQLDDSAKKAKDAASTSNSNQARREREQAFFDRIQRRMSRGLNLTEGHLEKAKGMGMTSLSRTIESRLAKQKSDAADKRVQDFEMAQHNKQVDAERKAKEKAEREAKQGSGKGGFFGGFGRNMVIGRLYAAANAAAAPLEAFATGIGVHWLKAWKTLTSVAFEAGKNISYTSGMADSANGVTNTLKFTQARLERQNSLYEMNSAVGSRAAAGMAGSSAGLAKGVAEAVGNALDNPLTGFTDIVGKIGNAVGMADPGTMNRYNMILRDLTATIGQGLAPVVQMITKLMKEFGDYLQPVIQTALPEIRKAMSSLFAAIQPLIPLFVKELGDTIKELIELIGQIGGKLGVREMIMRGVGVPDNIIKAGPGNGAAAVQQDRTMIGVGGGVLGGAALGAGLGSVIPGVGTLIGGVAGGVMGGIAGYMDSRPAAGAANGPAGIGNIMNQIGAMQKGNISGAAVAQNATIGSGSDIARKASQEAFISSSARGNIEQQNVFQVAAQAAIQFFQNANKPAPVANGNAQPGMAAGVDGQVARRKFALGLPFGGNLVEGMKLLGL